MFLILEKYFFNCVGINICVDITGISCEEMLLFDISKFCIKSHNDFKFLKIAYSNSPDSKWDKYYFPDSDVPFFILNNIEAEQLYLSKKNSIYLAYSPVSLSFFEQYKKSQFFVIRDAFKNKHLRNTIIRFFINHLIAAGGLFFHASGAVVDNKAFLMTGFSDVGKSTAIEQGQSE